MVISSFWTKASGTLKESDYYTERLPSLSWFNIHRSGEMEFPQIYIYSSFVSFCWVRNLINKYLWFSPGLLISLPKTKSWLLSFGEKWENTTDFNYSSFCLLGASLSFLNCLRNIYYEEIYPPVLSDPVTSSNYEVLDLEKTPVIEWSKFFDHRLQKIELFWSGSSRYLEVS